MLNSTIVDGLKAVEDVVQVTIIDYVFFVILLLVSAIIGVYFGFFQKKVTTPDEYLLGGKQMGIFEISMSLISSLISGFGYLAVPADIYRYGATFWFHNFSIALVILCSCFLVMPVFFKLKSPCINEYLKIRFDKRLRDLTALVSVVGMLLFLTIIIYLPALALAHITRFNLHYITLMISAVCIFYTTVGGLKAVVWTDALQLIVMVGASVMVIYIGTVSSGGFEAVWQIATEGERLTFDFDLNPTKRDTVWTNFIGMFFFWTNFVTFNQGTVQKLRSLPSLSKIKHTHIYFLIGVWIFFHFNIYGGILIYAKYYNCDPYYSKQIDAYDQILPYYVMDVSRNIPGLFGVFIAGMLSASLSTLSATMNSLSCIIYEDFLINYVPRDLTQRQISTILQILVVIVGVISYALVFIIQNFKSILEIAVTFNSFVQGPCTGIFILGMFIPKANAKGALSGAIAAIVIMGWIVFTASYYKMQGYMVSPTKPISTDECILPGNTTFRVDPTENSWEPLFIFRISHYYYSLLGCLIVFIVGVPVSYFTRSKNDPEVDKDLISPVMHWALKEESAAKRREYLTMEEANLKVVNGVDHS